MSLVFLVTGKPPKDFRPLNGATMLACAGEARLTAVKAGAEIMEEAMFSSP
uniref:Uncharacterized protein n=1 Tax=Rhizophora mucronata TaxID=61149 RepID=A0A2P2NBB3_RHIMU